MFGFAGSNPTPSFHPDAGLGEAGLPEAWEAADGAGDASRLILCSCGAGDRDAVLFLVGDWDMYGLCCLPCDMMGRKRWRVVSVESSLVALGQYCNGKSIPIFGSVSIRFLAGCKYEDENVQGSDKCVWLDSVVKWKKVLE